MAETIVPFDPTKAVEINVVCQSPHVALYRVWKRAPGGTWELAADGDTNDNVPDFQQLGLLAKGTNLAYWFGIGGKPKTAYRVLFLISQEGKLLKNGTFTEAGITDGNGFADVEDQEITLS